MRGVCAGLAIVLLLAGHHAEAERNSKQRVRVFARLPDWSGLWETRVSKIFTNSAGQGGPDFASATQLWGFAHPPYTPEWEAKYQAAMQDSGAAQAFAASFKGCGEGAVTLENFMPFVMDSPMVFEITVTPEQTLLTFDHGQIRYIYTDGRSHPKPADLWPTPMGDSVGHWEGQTLVVDTIARTPGPFVLGPPIELTAGARFTERLSLLDHDTLQDELTIDDPLRFSQPWKLALRFTRAADLDRMIPYDCEADRNPIVNGQLVIKPPPDPAGPRQAP